MTNMLISEEGKVIKQMQEYGNLAKEAIIGLMETSTKSL